MFPKSKIQTAQGVHKDSSSIPDAMPQLAYGKGKVHPRTCHGGPQGE